MMRTKLGLTEKEIMKKSWIALQLEMADFPYYDYKSGDKDGKKYVEVKAGQQIPQLDKYTS